MLKIFHLLPRGWVGKKRGNFKRAQSQIIPIFDGASQNVVGAQSKHKSSTVETKVKHSRNIGRAQPKYRSSTVET